MEFKSVEQAITFIRDKSVEYAKAKSDRVLLEQFRKSKKAMLMQEAGTQGMKAGHEREAYAYAHDDYVEILKGLSVAVEKEETLRYQIKAAELRFEMWRTQEASNRAEMGRYNSA